MSLKKYEAFAKTAELKSLTKAAEALGYTQSGISHILSSLEAELGFSVLRRSRGGVSLTSAGEKLLPKVQEILEMKRKIDELAASLASSTAGIVRVGAFTSVAVNWLPEILKKYRQLNPNVEIQLFSGDYHDIDTWLQSGWVDVGFLALPSPANVACIPLRKDPLLVILPQNHPLAQYERIPAELAVREPIISLQESSAQDVVRALGKTGIRPNICYTTKDDYAIIAMVRAGLGISIMPELLLTRNREDIAVRPLVPEAERTIAIGIHGTPTPAVSEFISCVQTWLQSNNH